MSQVVIAPPGSGRGVSPWVLATLGLMVLTVVWLGLTGAGGVILLGAVGAIMAVLIWRNPVIGIAIYVTTFLFTYPAALRGVGNFTINNLLGMLLVPLMLISMLREGSLRLISVRPLMMIGAGVAVVVMAASFYHPTEDPLAQRLEQKIERSKRSQGPVLIQTRGAQQKAITRFVFLCFFVYFVRTPRDLKIVAATVVGCLLASYLTASSGEGAHGWGEGRLRVLGEAGTGVYAARNPNKLAFFLLFCLNVLWYSRRQIRNLIMYPPWMVLTASTFAMIPLTGSRSGMLNLLLFVGIVLLEGRFSFRKIAGLAMVTVIFVVQFGYEVNILEYALPEDISARLTRFDVKAEVFEEGVEAHGSAQARQQTFKASLLMIPHHPIFGVGVGNFSYERAVVDTTGTIGPPHNSYLWAACEGGLVTLIIFLSMFYWVYRALGRIERNYDARFSELDMQWMVNAMRTSLIGFMFFSMFADMWLHVFFFVLIGKCICLIEMHRRYEETGRLPGRQTVTVLP